MFSVEETNSKQSALSGRESGLWYGEGYIDGVIHKMNRCFTCQGASVPEKVTTSANLMQWEISFVKVDARLDKLGHKLIRQR